MKGKKLTLITIMAFMATVVTAQKLPNVQTGSVFAPINVKIDGKADEWKNIFQAHNASADILYTIANDDKNLYLVVQAKDINVINTITGYGFEFEIQKSGKKDDKDKISISYPVVPKRGSGLEFGAKNGLAADTSSGKANAIMNNNNRVLEQKFKSIIVTGIKGFDTLSVYNEDRIKAAGLFDNKMVYTLEISIALKYIKLTMDDASKFAYHMIINGYIPPESPSGGPMKVSMLGSDGTFHEVDNNSPGIQQAIDDINIKFSRRWPHTDFLGEYTLAKK